MRTYYFHFLLQIKVRLTESGLIFPQSINISSDSVRRQRLFSCLGNLSVNNNGNVRLSLYIVISAHPSIFMSVCLSVSPSVCVPVYLPDHSYLWIFLVWFLLIKKGKSSARIKKIYQFKKWKYIFIFLSGCKFITVCSSICLYCPPVSSYL